MIFGRKKIKFYLSGLLWKESSKCKKLMGEMKNQNCLGKLTVTARWNHLFNEQAFRKTPSFDCQYIDFGISNISKIFDNDEY